MLQPESSNRILHAQTRAKAKMYEFAVPEEEHINLENISLSGMLDLTIGMLGDLAARGGVQQINQNKHYLLFSAQYISALLETNTFNHSNNLLKLLASSAYYLAGYPGSSNVILETIRDTTDCTLMEEILYSVLLRRDFSEIPRYSYEDHFANLRERWSIFLTGYEADTASLQDTINLIRSEIYAEGSDEDVLLVDVVKSIIARRIDSSVRKILTLHSGVPNDLWNSYFERPNSLKEFWPSQIKLAENGVFGGTSAVVQMPTSAGKTRSTEFIIRSSFMAGRSTLAVIVAPFRSLCQEIYNDFTTHFELDIDIQLDLVSDVLQEDVEIFGEAQKSILILTPEKLDYILRHQPELANRIGLIIYDEGHLFDDSSRGPKYELLLSSLKQKLLNETQVVLISAVISNAQEIKDWLIGQNGVLVDGSSLSPTSRNIAFTEWSTRYRNIQFVDPADINQSLFWVPTILRRHQLQNRGRERTLRYFPDPSNAAHIASYLGCRLASSGLSAVFTGKKSSVQKMLKDLNDAYSREIPVPTPISFSENLEEAEKVIRYVSQTLGEDSENALAARLGILSHHANIPHGLRLVTEHALSKSYFKTIICTSTLAQGVNLPIRYLIVASDRQARERIRTRDFHNLMGRAGRSGKYTEGTVIFANPGIYNDRNRGGRWAETAGLLNSNNSEPSTSRLLFLLSQRPQVNNDHEQNNWDSEVSIIKDGIYSYLLSALIDIVEVREADEIVTQLVRHTLGYTQTETDEEKAQLTELFVEIGREIITNIPSPTDRSIYARSILSADKNQSIVTYLRENIADITERAGNPNDLLEFLWSHLYQYSENGVLKSFSEADALVLCSAWINGVSFPEILSLASGMNRTTNRQITTNSIVDMCEGSFSYDLSTFIGSISELTHLAFPEEEGQSFRLEVSVLQKRLKYGLPNYMSVIVYELGFTDRRLSQELTEVLNNNEIALFKSDVRRFIRHNNDIREVITNNYPSYFLARYERV